MSTEQRRVNAVSPDEMRRRWSAVRAQMASLDLQALVMQNSSDWVGGYLRWFTNEPATNGYPSTLVFAAAGESTMIEQGPMDAERAEPAGDRSLTGVGRRLTTANYPSVGYTGGYDAALAARALRDIGARRVGLVAPAAMYHRFAASVQAESGDIEWVDFTDAVDRLKALKSDEERACIAQVARMQDEVLARVRSFVRPGLHEFEVAAYAQYVGQQLGSEQGIFLCSSAPPGEPAVFRPRWQQGRRLQAGDVFSLLIENNGAGGFYTELSRIFVLGRASARLRLLHSQLIEAQRAALELLQPGARCAQVAQRHNAWLRRQGLPEERRLNMHGMGYDMVERPLVRSDETLAIESTMSIVCHPGFVAEGYFLHNTDVYLIGEHGPGACLHGSAKELIEVV